MLKQTSLTMCLTASVVCGLLCQASCTSEDKKKATLPVEETILQEKGVAGGTVERKFTATATVDAIDQASRAITLRSENGNVATFTAGPEIRNLAQLKRGDRITATITERITVTVQNESLPRSASEIAAIKTAQPGVKPGAIIAEGYRLVATVKAIDTANRTADLQFVNDEIETFMVRPDVDLSKYKPGDTVIIDVVARLSILAE